MKTFPQSIDPLTPSGLVTSTYEIRLIFDGPQSPCCPVTLSNTSWNPAIYLNFTITQVIDLFTYFD